jgi:hypothetical protein
MTVSIIAIAALPRRRLLRFIIGMFPCCPAGAAVAAAETADEIDLPANGRNFDAARMWIATHLFFGRVRHIPQGGSGAGAWLAAPQLTFRGAATRVRGDRFHTTRHSGAANTCR